MLIRVTHLPLALAALLVLLLAFSLASERQTEAGSLLPTCGESNSGWESGDLTGWSQGTVTEIIEVVGVESVGGGEFTVGPLEGAKMVRLGDAKDSSGENQPPGPNELSQTFTVTNPKLRCAYYFWTYDWFGFDEVTVTLTRVSDGSTIYFARTGAFGPSGNTTLKGTGWRIVNVSLDAYVGQQVKLEFAAGGTSDSLYGSWAYIDSASNQQASTVVDTPATQVDGEPPMLDPTTGQLVIPQSPGDTSLTISTPIKCPDGTDPLSVTAILTKAPESVPSAPTIQISLAKGPDPSTVWTGTFPIPADQSDATVWDLNFTVECEKDGTINVPVGKVILIDPSGFITDAVTSLPIQGATVTLQRFDAGVWHDVNAFELVSGSPTIAPQVNPLLTNEAGHYAWDVAAGKYRVVVTADGYVGQTSKEVDIPPPVFDLDLALQPIGSPTWGDGDCNGTVLPRDGQALLRHLASQTPLTQTDPCFPIGGAITVFGKDGTRWGDWDCNGTVLPRDGQALLRHLASQTPLTQTGNCPAIGQAVAVEE